MKGITDLLNDLGRDGAAGVATRMRERLGATGFAAILASVTALPALLTLLYIRAFAGVSQSYDDLLFVPIYARLYSGQLSIADLFAPHNEHRMFFPKLALLVLGGLSHDNNAVQCYLSWLLLCLACWVLFAIHRRTFGTGDLGLVTFVPVTWLMFNWRQAENLLLGFQVGFFMVTLSFLLAIYLLATVGGRWWRFALSIACGVVCTLSLGNGLLVWPLGLAITLWTHAAHAEQQRRRHLAMGILWGLAGVAVTVVYFVDYRHASADSLGYCASHPQTCVVYLLELMGSLTYFRYAAPPTGLLVVALLGYVGLAAIRERGTLPFVELPVCIMLFAFLSALMSTYSRAWLQIGGLGSRLTTIPTLAMVGLYLAALPLTGTRSRGSHGVLACVACLIAVSGAVSYAWGAKLGPGWRDLGRLQAYYLSTASVQSDENLDPLLFGHHPDSVREAAEVLKRYGLGIFRTPTVPLGKLSRVEGPARFGIDAVDNRSPGPGDLQDVASTLPDVQQSLAFTVSKDAETITIIGWAIDETLHDAPGGIFVSIDGQVEIPALSGLPRPDVASAFGDDRYISSGFLASFATAAVGQGKHVLSFKAVRADGSGYYEPKRSILLEVK